MASPRGTPAPLAAFEQSFFKVLGPAASLPSTQVTFKVGFERATRVPPSLARPNPAFNADVRRPSAVARGLTPTLGVMIESCTSAESSEWLGLRSQLWLQCSREEHLAEMRLLAASPQRFAQFLAYAAARRAIGFGEVLLRSDYVNGAESLPVPFLEGLFVEPPFRRQGFGAALVHAVERWALSRGYRELSSDALAHNVLSHQVHQALGFRECERVVYFHKALRPP